MTEPRIVPPAEARALLSVATPGRWTAGVEWAAIGAGPDSVVHGYVHTKCDSCGEDVDGAAHVAMSSEDAELIVAAPDLAHTAAVLGEQVQAVLALHRPKQDQPGSLIAGTYCSCGSREVKVMEDGYASIVPAAYPCPTARALGVN